MPAVVSPLPPSQVATAGNAVGGAAASASASLEARQVTAGYGSHRVLEGVSFSLTPGAITGVLGPNGCGKSTLFKVLAGALRPTAGEVRLGGRPLASWTPRQIALQVARLPQAPTAPPGMTVSDLVALGRFPHLPWFGRPGVRDRAAIARAIGLCELEDLRERVVTTLSGGERQRAWIAMTLAQEPTMLLLDEPTAALDIHHQLDVLNLLQRLNRETGLTVGLVIHDLNMALHYCDRLMVMERGRIVADGPWAETLTPALMQSVFHVNAERVHAAPGQADTHPTRPVYVFRRAGAGE